MQTQLTCPNCGTPYMADIYQVIDAARQPQLKQMLLSGQLNVAVCPSCGAGGRVATPLLYHDPAHELFMVHVPQEMNLDQVQREEMIGRMVSQVVDQTPAEQRKGYMLQPQTILTMQGFMEKVLETEGITPEMVARQQKQAELVDTLSKADKDVVDYLLKERGKEIDETFFAILRAQIDAAEQANDNKRMVQLVNLQAKLMTTTEVGRELERRQMALHALNREAQKAGGLSPELLLKHIIANKDDEVLVNTIAVAGQAALTYDFFTKLTDAIDSADEPDAAHLKKVRDDLLRLQQEMREASQQMLAQANEALDAVLASDDVERAVLTQAGSIDEAFMHVLSARLMHAEQSNKVEEVAKLKQVEAIIMSLMQTDAPPELDFLNHLVQATTVEDRAALIEESKEMVSPDLLELVDALIEQSRSSGQADLAQRLGEIREQLETVVGAAGV